MTSSSETTADGAPRASGATALGIAAATTLLVTIVSYGLPGAWAASGVGFAFLGVTGSLVLRHDAETIRRFGLSLGGVFEPSPIVPRALVRSAATACAWAFALGVLVLPVFAAGFRLYWGLHGFRLRWPPGLLDEVAGQLLVVALPEEAFYRGYLLTALDEAWGARWTVGGAKIGWGLLASSAVFALGHLFTEPNLGRLAVFFPALLFGWLRARTGGVGAGIVFHALCNLFASMLVRGFGLGG